MCIIKNMASHKNRRKKDPHGDAVNGVMCIFNQEVFFSFYFFINSAFIYSVFIFIVTILTL